MILRDAHVHLAAHGEELSCVNLSACGSCAECLEMVRAAAAASPEGWVRAVAARVEGWGGDRWPTARELSEAVGGRAVVVMSFDHHALVASEAALAAAGIGRDTPDPPRGVIVRDAGTGQPTGLLLEEACRGVQDAIPAPTDAQYRAHIVAGLADFAARGFVEIHDMLSTPQMARVLLDLEREGELAMDVRLYAMREHFDGLARDARKWKSERVRFSGLKIFTDGTLNSRTAHMLHPFADPLPGHPNGKALMSGAEIEEAVRHADALGYPIAAHAIGDGAVRATLDAIERASPSTIGQRIEHAQFVDDADVARFAAMGVIASVQPCHLLTDIEGINRLTPDRAGRAFPLRDLVDAAVAAGFEAQELVWLGSDAPIVPPSPEDNVQAAVHRRRAGMRTGEAVGAAQAITEAEALALMRAPEA